jgi:arginyl-tRNA--protein-N-Asp/Glu arginylyltransferase
MPADIHAAAGRPWTSAAEFRVQLPRGIAFDVHLADGWEFVGPLLHRCPFGHLPDRTVGLVPIRQPIQEVGLSRNQRKLLARNRRRFRIEISTHFDLSTREALYATHRSRFIGESWQTLQEYLGRYQNQQSAECREIAVYDGTQLAAVSYVLVGAETAYSLLGLFDPAYARYSLGTHTLLEEIDLLRRRRGRYYYPGHFHLGNDALSYKLRLRGLQYLHWNTGWAPIEQWAPAEHPKSHLDARLDQLHQMLTELGHPNTRQSYLMSGLSGLARLPALANQFDQTVRLFDQPEYLDCGLHPLAPGWRIVAFYDFFRRRYGAALTTEAPKADWQKPDAPVALQMRHRRLFADRCDFEWVLHGLRQRPA